MSLPFNLQRLPPEAISVLRFLGQRNAAAYAREMEEGLEIGSRSVGKAIRRLVNYSLIQIDMNGSYGLTSDGKRAYGQLVIADGAESEQRAKTQAQKIMRRLTVVLPNALLAAQPATVYIGVNPPDKSDSRLAQLAHVELRLSAVGGELSTTSLSLEVPPDKAADPARLTVAVRQPVRSVRVRIDAFQSFDIDRIEAVGGMYFDIPVLTQPLGEEATRRAVGVDLALS